MATQAEEASHLRDTKALPKNDLNRREEKPGSNQVEECRDYFLLQSLGNQVKIRL